MDDILSLLQTLKSSGAEGAASVELIQRYTENVVKNPTTAKYRRIRIGNAKFNAVIWSQEAARNLVFALGFEQEGDDFLVLPEDVDLTLLRDLFAMPQLSPPQKSEAPSLRLGRLQDKSFFDSMQADMTLLSYLVEMGYEREVGRRALVATGNKGVQPAMDWISSNPLQGLIAEHAPIDDVDDVVKVTTETTTPAQSIVGPVSRYESTAGERHAFQEKRRKEEILVARLAKKEEIAAKKILMSSVEAEKKMRQFPNVVAEPKVDPPPPVVVKASPCPTVAVVKLRMPNGEACTFNLLPSDTIGLLYQRAAEKLGTPAEEFKLLVPSGMQVYSDHQMTLENAGLTPRGMAVVQLLSQTGQLQQGSEAEETALVDDDNDSR